MIAEGSVKGQAIHLTVYERVNTTREELRYASTYRPGQTLEVGRGGAQDVGIKAGRYDVLKVHANGKVELSDGRRRIRFDPQKLSPTEQRDRLLLSEKKALQLREGDRIRWTANDKERGLHNAALARVVGVDVDGVKVETADKALLTLGLGDPMLSRLDLAYSLNMHMAQGITTDKAITVMSSHERIVILALLGGAAGLSGPPPPVAKPFMTRREEAMLVVLEEIFPMYRFHAQVAMGALLKVPARMGHRVTPADRNAFSQKIVDFVVHDPTTGRVVALIEVDDGSHNAARDRIRDAMTDGAGYRTFRIPASARPTISAVLRIVGPLREEAVQNAFEG